MNEYDPRYQRGKIYTITCEDGAVYVGSTIQTLNDRFNNHKADKDCSLYYYINNNYNGDWSKCKIELYENYPSNNKKELEKKEGEITLLIGTINKLIAGRTKKEYAKDNKEIIEKNYKIWYEKNKGIKNKNVKDYYENNKDIISIKNKKKIECDCGCILRKDSLTSHIKRNIHQDLMDKQTSAILLFLECF